MTLKGKGQVKVKFKVIGIKNVLIAIARLSPDCQYLHQIAQYREYTWEFTFEFEMISKIIVHSYKKLIKGQGD